MNIPNFIYGTAWKEGATTELTRSALEAGFRGIDTANQPRHYQEALVGEAFELFLREGGLRESIFLQTKFTPLDGHDQRVPYDSSAELRTQVMQSFESSLNHLHTEYLDSYLLHGPYSRHGLSQKDWEVWNAMEELHNSERAKMIGISNVNFPQLEQLVKNAHVKPKVVQNRCFAVAGWDREVRSFCKTHDIIYQGFSLLTANPHVLENPKVLQVAAHHQKTPAQVLFRFAHQVGMVPLTGTTSEKHMKEDLQISEFELTGAEVELIDLISLG